MTLRPLHLTLALLVFIGCGGTDPEHSVDLSGRWSDPNDPGLGTVTLHHDLSTDSLSGTWTHGDSLTLVGSLAGRSVSMQVYSAGHFVFTYSGTVESDGKTITGTTLDWEGGSRPLTLTRESRL